MPMMEAGVGGVGGCGGAGVRECVRVCARARACMRARACAHASVRCEPIASKLLALRASCRRQKRRGGHGAQAGLCPPRQSRSTAREAARPHRRRRSGAIGGLGRSSKNRPPDGLIDQPSIQPPTGFS